MKRRLVQCGIFTGIVCVSSLIAMTLFGRASTDLAELILKPWFGLCRAVTPVSWQTQGNIPIGMMWVVSGMVAYSVAMGGAFVGILIVADKLRKANQELKATGKPAP